MNASHLGSTTLSYSCMFGWYEDLLVLRKWRFCCRTCLQTHSPAQEDIERVCCVLNPDLVAAVILLLHRVPRLPVVTVRNLEDRHKLHHAEVFGPLSDDPADALGLLQVHLGMGQG